MKYSEKIVLKDGREALIRNGEASDGEAVFEVFNRTHGETDYLLSYPDENSYDVEGEGRFLQSMTDSSDGIELVGVVDGKVVGTAGIGAVGKKYKVRHRAEFGIGILMDYWGLGLGKALAKACIRCAEEAGYEQLELNAVSGNERAISLYESLGFEEFGRNPRGFRSRISGYQEVVYMLLKL